MPAGSERFSARFYPSFQPESDGLNVNPVFRRDCIRQRQKLMPG